MSEVARASVPFALLLRPRRPRFPLKDEVSRQSCLKRWVINSLRSGCHHVDTPGRMSRSLCARTCRQCCMDTAERKSEVRATPQKLPSPAPHTDTSRLWQSVSADALQAQLASRRILISTASVGGCSRRLGSARRLMTCHRVSRKKQIVQS